jgi:hypothetical protein
MTFVTPKAAAKPELLFNKMAFALLNKRSFLTVAVGATKYV